MGDKYSAVGTYTNPGAGTLSGCPLTITNSGTTVRGRMYEIIQSFHPEADKQYQFQVSPVTSAGTGTAFTPSKLDGGAPASNMTIKTALSAPPIGGQNVLQAYINQRAIFRWVAVPGGEIVIPATSGYGYEFFAIALTTAGGEIAGTTILWEE